MAKLPSLDELHAEIAVIRRRYALPSDDHAFVMWYSSVALTGDDTKAQSCIVGGSGDISADAIHIDDSSQIVFLVQAKYRKTEAAAEARNDLLGLRDLGISLGATDKESREFLRRALEHASQFVAKRLEEARERIVRRHYFVSMRFVTTGRVSAGLAAEFEWGHEQSEFIAQDNMRVRRLFRDYLDGAAPPVASVDLRLDRPDTMRWHDKKNEIGSWIVTASGAEIARLYRRTGPRVFARNIRGFLGSTEINKGMRHTLKSEPEKFWYYNNGITIVCDKASRIQEDGRDVLRIENPQIINGQQTTRVLAVRGESFAAHHAIAKTE